MLLGQRVLIRVDGTAAIGLGHVARMRTLAKALKLRGARVTALTMAGSLGETILKQAGIEVKGLAAPPSPENLRRAALEIEPDLVVIDTLDTTSEHLAALRVRGALVTFDDCAAGLTAADVVINAIVFHWEKYRSELAKARVYEGPEYMILASDVMHYIGARPAPAAVATRLLIAVGGTDTRAMSPLLLRSLQGTPRPLQVRVNLGPGAPATAAMDLEAVGTRHELEILRAAPSLAAEFLKADLVLSGGGNMLYELAALGVPAAAIATEDHEALNIAYWSNQGTVEDLGHWQTADEQRIGASIARLIEDAGRRQLMVHAGRARVDGGGLQRCMDILDDLAA